MGSQEDDVGSKTSSYSWGALDRERTLQPPNTFFPGWVGFFLKRKTNILLHKDIGQGKSNCVEWWKIWLFFLHSVLRITKDPYRKGKKKKITILSVFYLSMFRLERHCYINRNHNNKNWTYLFQTYVWIISLFVLVLLHDGRDKRALHTRNIYGWWGVNLIYPTFVKTATIVPLALLWVRM